MSNVVSVARRLGQRELEQTAFAFLGEVPAVGGNFPLAEISPDCLCGAIVRWLSQGHALSFGLSSDGGALGVHLIVSGSKRTRWFNGVAELEDFLTTIPGPVDP